MKKYFDRCGVEICAGYRLWNGYILTSADARNYNSFTEEIERLEAAGFIQDAEFIKDCRHKFMSNLHNG